jgi:hypothetical protein
MQLPSRSAACFQQEARREAGLNRIAHQAVNRVLLHTESDGSSTTPSSREAFHWINIQTVGFIRLPTIT